MSKKTIGIFVGSLRRDSFSKKVAEYLSGLLAEQFEVKFMDIASVDMFNQDLDNETPPPEWTRLRREVRGLDAVLFVTPEYNRSMPAALKNALDVASLPYTANAWSGKPGAVVSVSPGNIGGFGGNNHLRQSAACLNILMMQQPEAYIGSVYNSFREDGLPDNRLQAFLRKFADAYAAWVNRLAA